MKRLATWFTAALLIGTALVSCSVPVGTPAPDFSGEWWNAPPGQSLAEMRGRVVLVEFWRTW